MNPKSLQFRLTLWYALSLVIASAVIFAGFYLVTKTVLLTQTDATLSVHGNQIVAAIANQQTDMHQMLGRQTFLQQLEEAPGMLVVVMDSSGAVVSSSQKITLSQDMLARVFTMSGAAQDAFFTNETVGGIPMRFWIYPIRENASLAAVVVMGHPTEVIQQSLNRLSGTLAALFFLLLIPTVIGGYLHARAAVQPISIISETLKRISHENLNERVPVPNSGDQIAELATTFNGLLDRLHGAFTRERQFIGDIAHELKTPLAILQTNTEVTLSKKRTGEAYKHALIETQTDTKRIAETLSAILDLAWSEADYADSSSTTVNVSTLVSELQEITGKLAAVKNITVKGVIQSDVMIRGKEDKLSRAILNVCENAVKYTPRNGTITLSLHTHHQTVELRITDTGPGIAKRDLPHIFDRFYRGSKTAKTVGSGLGLAIAKATIAAHHGTIRAQSAVGKGSVFIISLPVYTTPS